MLVLSTGTCSRICLFMVARRTDACSVLTTRGCGPFATAVLVPPHRTTFVWWCSRSGQFVPFSRPFGRACCAVMVLLLYARDGRLLCLRARRAPPPAAAAVPAAYDVGWCVLVVVLLLFHRSGKLFAVRPVARPIRGRYFQRTLFAWHLPPAATAWACLPDEELRALPAGGDDRACC